MKKRVFYLLFIVLVSALALVLVGCGDDTTEKKDDPVEESEKKEEPVVTNSGISIKTPANETVFEKGTDIITEGLVIQLDKSDDTHVVLDADKYTVDTSAYNKDKAGEYEIKITHKEFSEFTCSYKVTVKEMVNLTLEANPELTTYDYVGWYSEELGLKVTINYSDGSKETYENPEELYSFFVLEGSEDNPLFGNVIPVEEGENTITLYLAEDETIRGSLTYTVYDEEKLTITGLVVTQMPYITEYASIDDYDEYGISLGYTVAEFENRTLDCYSFGYNLPVGENLTGDLEIEYFDLTSDLNTTIKVKVYDLSDYTLDRIQIAEGSSYRTIYYTFEDEATLDVDTLTVQKVYTKAGTDDIVLACSSYGLSNDGEIDTTTTGNKTLTVSVDGTEKTCTIEVEVKEFVFADGIYAYDMGYSGESLVGNGLVVIMFKVESGKIYLYDTETESYAQEDSEILGCEFGYVYDDNYNLVKALTIVLYVDEETGESSGITYCLVNDTLVLYKNYTTVRESDLVSLVAYLDAYNCYKLVKTNNKLSKDLIDGLSLIGNLSTDAEGKNLITEDTVITGSVVYLTLVQEDYTGKPFLGTWEYEGETCYVIGATSINVYGEDGNPGMEMMYTATQNETGYVVTMAGISFVYDSTEDTLTLDFGFYQLVMTRKQETNIQ